jgi:hypothetical protein
MDTSCRESFAHHAPSFVACLHKSRTDFGTPARGSVAESEITFPFSGKIVSSLEVNACNKESLVSPRICMALFWIDNRKSFLAFEDCENLSAKALNPEEMRVVSINSTVSSWNNIGNIINKRGNGVGS